MALGSRLRIIMTATKTAEVSSASTASSPPPLINLLRGWPARTLLPAAALRTAMDRVLTTPSLAEPSLLYGPDPGYQPLRELLAAYLHETFQAHGAPADAERICITGGASQNVACLLQSFTDPAYTRGVWVVAPAYHLMCPVFEDNGFAGRLHAVPEDEEGVDVERLEALWAEDERAEGEGESSQTGRPALYKTQLAPLRKAYRRVVYVVPTSSNPSGRSMTRPRREALVRLARRYDALVICDDVYDFLQWPVEEGDAAVSSASATSPSVPLPPPLPRLVDVDRLLPHDDPSTASPFGHVVSNGSFSKMVGPGVRTGWAEGTPALAFGLAQTASSKSGGAPSQLCASMIAEMLRAGDLERHLATVVRPALQRRHRVLLAAIDAHLADHVVVEGRHYDNCSTFGGYFVWLRLRRPDIDAEALAHRVMATAHLVVPPGTLFAVKGDEAASSFRHHIRLCFAYEDEARLTEGIARLGRLLRDWDVAGQDDAGSIDKQGVMDQFK